MNSLSQTLVEYIARYPYQDHPAFQKHKPEEWTAVLIPILRQNDWFVFLTERSHCLRNHAGEICFPGGRRENSESLEQTAVRETKEELGLTVTQVVGRISSVPLFTSHFRLVPYIGFIEEEPRQVNPQEVASVLPISISTLCHLPYIQGVPFLYQEKEILSPVFSLKDIMPNPPTTQPIYGGTAIVLYELITIFCSLLDIPVPKLQERESP